MGGIEDEFLLLIHEIVSLTDEHTKEQDAGGENVLYLLGEIVREEREELCVRRFMFVEFLD